MSRDNYNEILPVKALNPQTVTTGTVDGLTVDRIQTTPKANEFQSVTFVVSTGTLTDGTYTVTIRDSADGVTFADAAAADILGTEPVIADTNDDTVFSFGYDGLKRYVRLQIVAASATTGGTISAVAILGHGRHVQTR